MQELRSNGLTCPASRFSYARSALAVGLVRPLGTLDRGEHSENRATRFGHLRAGGISQKQHPDAFGETGHPAKDVSHRVTECTEKEDGKNPVFSVPLGEKFRIGLPTPSSFL